MAGPAKPRPTVYYIRHGETDWNVGGRLQGRRDVPLNARGRGQAAHSGGILRDLFARDSRDPAELDYVSSPLMRASATMELARTTLGLPAQGYVIEPRLAEIAFGDWEGSTIKQLHERDPVGIAQREHDKWHFQPPGGESYQQMSLRIRDWYESLERHGGGRAWRHRARADRHSRHQKARGGALGRYRAGRGLCVSGQSNDPLLII